MINADHLHQLRSDAVYDVALVGVGLANGLIAAALLHKHPLARIAVIDQKPAFAFNQTWCFHRSDVPSEDVWPWLQPFIAQQWQGYDVAFAKLKRGFDGCYLGISGDKFADVLASLFNRPTVHVYAGQNVAAVRAGEVTLLNGQQIPAQLVLDGRGAMPRTTGTGFQKFVGWDVQLDVSANPLPSRPLLMDACVQQVDGYRFVYVLPLGPDRALLEDTYFSSTPELCVSALESRLEQYISNKGWRLRTLHRREQGVLPMPWKRAAGESPFAVEGVIQVGYRGGWYQPATGYSVPQALIVANAIAGLSQLTAESATAALQPVWRRHDARAGFYRLLNRLAFRGVNDEDRFAVFERFYRLPVALVERFYAGQSTWWDRARIMGGRPPVPLSKFQMARVMEEVS